MTAIYPQANINLADHQRDHNPDECDPRQQIKNVDLSPIHLAAIPAA